jgi:predicted  nucleic acid-binding Zn-ribbon protein
MTNEEIQKVMEFIIKQQESFAEAMTQSEARISTLERATVNLYSTITQIGKAQEILTVKMSELADKMAELAEAQAHTEQRLNVVIDIIERGQGGRSQQ